MSVPLTWRWTRFDDLTLRELQAIHRARQEVFVLEQNCVYLDADAWDESAFHLAAWSDAHAVPLAYARWLDPGVKYPEPSLGRVLTTTAARGSGLGRELVQRALDAGRQTHPGLGVRISAQSRLERFYAGYGFEIAGARYLEDGIEHTEMLLRPPAPVK